MRRGTAPRPRGEGRSSPAAAGWRTGLAVAAALAAASSPLIAASPSSALDSTPVEVKAARACFSDNVRVTGYLVHRRETFVTLNADGFRVSEVLVQEGDAVANDQELVRLTRLASNDPSQTGRPGAPPGLTLRAPAAGTIVRSAARVGALTQPQMEPLFRLVIDPAIDALVEVPSLYVAKVRAGASAKVLLDNGREVEGVVRVPATEVDPMTQFGRARVSVSPDPALRVGMFASALIDTARSCGVAVPRTAIIRQNDTASVRVVRDGRTEMRRVRIGLSSDDDVEIREGLAEGESIVANAGLAF